MTWFDRAALALAALVLSSGCGREPEGFFLRPLVGTRDFTVGKEADGLSFAKAPEVAEITVDYERRPVVLTSQGTWRWRGVVPEEGARFHAGVQILPAAWQAVEELEVRVIARDGKTREILDYARASRQPSPAGSTSRRTSPAGPAARSPWSSAPP